MLDLFGKAILDFQTNNSPSAIITETNISEADDMDVAYLFRTFKEMPKLEQKALELAKGKVLDIGCGAGSHSLYLQEKGFDVTSMDISANAIKACQLRGLKKTKVLDILDFELLSNKKFDTILLLMNGTGIFETLSKAPKYLSKLKNLLTKEGQILIDSSDIIYMCDQDDMPTENYYGELEFTISYKNEIEKPFPWLFMDFKTLQKVAVENGFKCQKILEGEHYDYLARLSFL